MTARPMPILLGCLVLGACQPAAPPSVAVAVAPASASPSPAMPESAPGQATASGRVVETMNSSGYTYVRVAPAEGAEFWAATTEFPVKVGDRVLVDVAMPMENYTSKSLGRTFDLVYFAESIQVAGSGAGSESLLRQLSPPPSSMMDLPAGHGRAAAAAPASISLTGIDRAPDGLTVAEILARAESLAGSDVSVRARVVKFTPGVMGKNWLHLRDGSGEGGQADITVTTDDAAAIGDLVVAKGRIATKLDLGSGYSYDVIMQDAKLTLDEAPTKD